MSNPLAPLGQLGYTNSMTHTPKPEPVKDRYGTAIRIGALVQYIEDVDNLGSTWFGRVVVVRRNPDVVGVRWNIGVPMGAHAGDPERLIVHQDNDEIAMHIRHTLGVPE